MFTQTHENFNLQSKVDKKMDFLLKSYQKLSVSFMCLILISEVIAKGFERKDILSYVVVHLDFKGVPPKLTYLSSILKDLKSLGANGLLLEYEDLFPFEGSLQDLSAGNAYNRPELSNFLSEAALQGFELIPFVQSSEDLVHTCPKYDRFLRMRGKYFPNFQYMLRGIIEQIIKFHSKIAPIKFFHIGCDVSQHLNGYNDSHELILTMKKVESNVIQTSQFVRTLSPKTKVLMWDGLFRGYMDNFSKALFFQIHPVSWLKTYVKPCESTMMKHKEYFENIWAASAFKGADGQRAMFPELIKRFNNHCNWLRIISSNTYLRYMFKGIILTGRSSYSHAAPFCELITSSIPSLYLSLLLITEFKQSVASQQIFNCDLKKPAVLSKLKSKLTCLIEDDIINQMYYYNCTYNGSEVNHVLLGLKDAVDSLNQFGQIRYQLHKAMSPYYDNQVIDDFTHDKIRLH